MKSLILLIALFFNPNSVLAHGEDQLGPHKGFIRMPGAFHTEVVLDGSQTIKVYLLDLEWKNPLVEKSSVQVSYLDEKKMSESALCKAKKDFFLCSFSRKVNLKKNGTLKVIALRKDQVGQEAIYDLPLKLLTPLESPSVDHSKHH
jgi:hypothetical protein